jgi:hypothetical protein
VPRPPGGIALAAFMCRATTVLTFRARRYDVVHFGDFVIFPLAVWVCLVAPRTTRRLLTVHGLDLVFGQRRGWKSHIYRAYLALARPLQPAVHQLIANSSATAHFARTLGLRNVVSVPLGVRLDPDPPAPGATGTAGGASPDSSDGRYILLVGRVRAADAIHLMEEGRMAASGTYDELVRHAPSFRRMAEAGQAA